MANMSYYEVDRRADKQELNIVIKVPESKREEGKTKDEVTIADYGEFSGTYIDTTKSDYQDQRRKWYVK